jgi:hypothetical protein
LCPVNLVQLLDPSTGASNPNFSLPMDPEIQAIADMIDRKFEEIKSQTQSSYKDLDEKLEARFEEIKSQTKSNYKELDRTLDARFSCHEDAWERRFADLQISHDTRMRVLERAASTFDDWSASMEGTVDDIKLEVGKLSRQWERSLCERSPPLIPSGASPSVDPKNTPVIHKSLLPRGDVRPSSASGRPSAADIADRPHGHSLDNLYREGGYGSVTTIVHPPVKGVCRLPTPPPKCSIPLFSQEISTRPVVHAGSGQGRLPKLNFPSFDGTDPKLWLSRCVDYFELYDVERPRWIMVAMMHFIPPASHWLPSVESKLKSFSWLEFSSIILDRFGRDQHELLVRQLLSIKQSGTVVEYIEKFAGLIDQLAAYEGLGNTLHYTMRFIDGLKDELKGVVLIQRPKELDAAYVLAQLQEELVDSTRKKDYRKSEYPSKSYFKQLDTSPSAPPRQFKPSMFPAEDRRSS